MAQKHTVRGKFEKPEIQAQIQKMTNWQRNQWARAGYVCTLAAVRKFATMKRPERTK